MKVVFECDNGNVIDYITGENQRPHINKLLVNAVRHVMDRTQEIVFSKVLREGDKVGNALAKKAHNLTRGYHYFHQVPIKTLHILNFDRDGGTRPRFCNQNM